MLNFFIAGVYRMVIKIDSFIILFYVSDGVMFLHVYRFCFFLYFVSKLSYRFLCGMACFKFNLVWKCTYSMVKGEKKSY